VLVPLCVVVLLSGLVRHYLARVLTKPPKPQPLLVVREQCVSLPNPATPPSTEPTTMNRRALTRAQVLRANSSHLPPAAFVALRSHLQAALEDGSYLKKPAPPEGSAPPNPLDNPQDMEQMMEGMTDMMKKQAVGFVPQVRSLVPPELLTLHRGLTPHARRCRWEPCTSSIGSSQARSSVRSLTSRTSLASPFTQLTGRPTARIPFPLPLRFKELLQRGIYLPDLTLDASWCSATSWYFLCMFGLGPVYQLLVGDSSGALAVSHFLRRRHADLPSPHRQRPRSP